MEFYDYFRKSGFKVMSSAKEIKKAVTAIKTTPADAPSILRKLKWQITEGNDVADNWDAARSWLEHHHDEIKNSVFKYDLDYNNADAIADFLDKVADEKKATKTRIHEEQAQSAPVTADYTIYGLKKEKEAIELFNCIPVIKPNKHDKALMSCFAIMGNAVVFKANGHCYRLMTKTGNGRPQIVFSAGDSGSEGVINEITSALSLQYERYMRLLQTKVGQLEEYPDDDEVNEDGSDPRHPIEDIFLNDVPTIFRHIVEIRKTYKKDSEDSKVKHFQHYRVYAKRGVVNELTVSSFVEWLAANWTRASREILERSPKYLVFSNDPQQAELSVHRFIIWPEAEWRKAEIPESWDEIFGVKASPRLLHRLYFFIGSLLDARNSAQQYLAISDPGQTGKGLLIELLTETLQNITGTNMIIHLDNSVFKDDNQFGLSSLQVWNYRIGVVDEYDGRSLNTNKSKAIIGGDHRSLDMKFADSVDWDTKQFRLIAPSNNGFVLRQHSLRRRCIPITFKATHSSIDNLNDSDKKRLVDDGEAFLKFCWRTYMESPMRQRDGGYFVCCPEDEELYRKGEFFVPSGEINPKTGEPILKPAHDDKMRYLRAFSHDPEISAFYTVDDYEDSDITEGFNRFVSTYCDVSEDESYQMKTSHFFNLVCTYAEIDRTLVETFGDALKVKKFGHESNLVFDYRAGDYKTFVKYMENHGHASQHFTGGNAFMYIRIKEDYITKDGQIIQPETRIERAKATKYNSNPIDMGFLENKNEEDD